MGKYSDIIGSATSTIGNSAKTKPAVLPSIPTTMNHMLINPIELVYSDLTQLDKVFKNYKGSNKVGSQDSAFAREGMISIADFFKEILDKLLADINKLGEDFSKLVPPFEDLGKVNEKIERLGNKFWDVLKNRAKSHQDQKEIDKIYSTMFANIGRVNTVFVAFNEKHGTNLYFI
jgi:GMP synthase PP-ATPase subunit